MNGRHPDTARLCGPGKGLRLALWLGLLPAALLLASLWAMSAADAYRTDIAARQTAWQAKNGQNPSTLLFGQRQEKKALDLEETRATVLVILSRTASGASLVVLVLSITAWAGLRRAERKSRRSREAMLDAYGRLLRHLFVLFPMLTTLPAFSAACLLAFAGAAPEQMRAGDIRIDMALFSMSLACLLYGLSALIVVVRFARRARDAAPVPMTGRQVTPEEEPKLWAFVRDMARKMNARPPDHVVLGLEDTFFITSHEVLLRDGTRLSGCTLYLGVPYMAYLSRQHLEAVTCHELAHYQGADLEYSLRLAPFYQRATHLENMLVGMGNGLTDFEWLIRTALLLCACALDGFFRSLSAWSRVGELQADQASLRVVGAQAVAEALVRVHLLAPFVYAALEQAHSGTMRGSVLEALRELVRQSASADSLQEHLQEEQKEDPLSSHPSLRLRLEQFGVSPKSPWLREAARLRETELLRDILN